MASSQLPENEREKIATELCIAYNKANKEAYEQGKPRGDAFHAMADIVLARDKEQRQTLLDRVKNEVIDKLKDIYLTNDITNLLITDDYIKIREELRKEQHKYLDALQQIIDTPLGNKELL